MVGLGKGLADCLTPATASIRSWDGRAGKGKTEFASSKSEHGSGGYSSHEGGAAHVVFDVPTACIMSAAEFDDETCEFWQVHQLLDSRGGFGKDSGEAGSRQGAAGFWSALFV